MLRIILTVAVLTVATGGVSAANAADRQSDQMTVSSRNVDFNNGSAVKQFYTRLEVAANSVCSSEGAVDPMTAEADKTCAAQSVSDAVRDINQPALTQYADSRTGKSTLQLASTTGWNKH